MDSIVMRQAKSQDWYFVWNWMKALGWINVGLETGFLPFKMRHMRQIVAVNENDEPLSFISYYKKDDFAFINVYITEKSHRGLGIGTALWNKMMENLKDVSNIGIGSGGTMTEKYNNIHGFHIQSPVKFLRYTGVINVPKFENYLNKDYYNSDIEIYSIQNDKDIENVVRFDEQVIGFDRGEFLWAWLRSGRVTVNQPNPVITSYCAMDRESGEILGYGTISPAMECCKVGPLYAKDDQTAFHLLYELLKSYTYYTHKSDSLIINIPSTNMNMIDAVEYCGLEKVFALDLSYTTMLPEIYYKYIYSVTSHVGQID